MFQSEFFIEGQWYVHRYILSASDFWGFFRSRASLFYVFLRTFFRSFLEQMSLQPYTVKVKAIQINYLYVGELSFRESEHLPLAFAFMR